MRTTFRAMYRMRRNGYSGPFFLSLILIFSGAWLILPLDTFSHSEAYGMMDEWASEIAWGCFLILASLAMLAGAIQRRPREVAIGALASAAAWFITFASVAASGEPTLLVPITFGLLLRSAAIYREFMGRQDDPHLTEGTWQ